MAESVVEPVMVIHVAGADILVDDPLAGLHLSPAGLVRRDVYVAGAVRERGIPLLHLLAGGYGPSAARSQEASVAAMLELVRDGIDLLEPIDAATTDTAPSEAVD